MFVKIRRQKQKDGTPYTDTWKFLNLFKIPKLPIVHQSQLLPYIEGHGKGISHVALNFRKKS